MEDKLKLMLFFFLLALLIPVPNFAAAGWLSGWQYRRAITITNSASTSLTDYQVKITIDTASLISAGKMRSDGGDIRFTSSDGTTLLSYWIESGINTASTVIWVKVPSIPASSSTTIYIYYGNPSATSQSSGANTFIFFDDFNTLNTTKWDTITFNNGALSVSSGQLVLNVNNANGYSGAGVISKSTFSGTYLAIETLMKRNTGKKIGELGLFVSFVNKAYRDTTYYGHYYSNSASVNYIGAMAMIYEYTAGGWRLAVGYDDKTANGPTTLPTWDGVWVRISCFVNNLNKITKANFTYSGQTATLTTASGTNVISPLYLQIYYVDYQQSNTQSYVDWVAVRKWYPTEPSTSIGSEETPNNPPTVSIASVSPSSIYRGNYVTISGSASDSDGNVTAVYVNITAPNGALVITNGLANGTTSWSYKWGSSALSQLGYYSVCATAVDNANAKTQSCSSNAFQVLNNPPTITANGTYGNPAPGRPLIFWVNATDFEDSTLNARITITAPNSSVVVNQASMSFESRKGS